MNFGKILNEPFADYLATDCVGSHRINDVLPRPRVYFEKHIAKQHGERADTPAFLFGRLFHCLALEGEAEMVKRFVVAPDVDRRTKAGKEEFAAFQAQAGGRDIVKQADIDLAWQMVAGIRAKPAAVAMQARGSPEVTFRHQLASFAVQARVDWFDGEDPAGPLCINVKTVETLEDFDAQFCKFHYYRGDAFYRLVVAKVLGVEPTVPQMVNLVVEKSPPYECAIRVPDAESLDVGSREVMQRLAVIARCYESGEWPGEPNEARRVSLPSWKTKEAA